MEAALRHLSQLTARVGEEGIKRPTNTNPIQNHHYDHVITALPHKTILHKNEDNCGTRCGASNPRFRRVSVFKKADSNVVPFPKRPFPQRKTREEIETNMVVPLFQKHRDSVIHNVDR